MENTFNQFFSLNNGKPIEVEDPSNYSQCMDLIFAWCDYIKIPRDTVRHLYAKDVWYSPTASTYKYFDLIPNGLLNVPKVGDILVFGTKVGPVGHVAIETGKSNYLNAVTFDQNWAGAGYARVVTHNFYYGVLGWLHPKDVPVLTCDQKLTQVKQILNSAIPSDTKISQCNAIL